VFSFGPGAIRFKNPGTFPVSHAFEWDYAFLILNVFPPKSRVPDKGRGRSGLDQARFPDEACDANVGKWCLVTTQNFSPVAPEAYKWWHRLYQVFFHVEEI
jgi:hypothetical protein